MASNSTFHRPRRPNTETISYLRGLPLNVKTAKEEVTRFLSSRNRNDEDEINDQDFPHNLAASFSALDEVKGEVASLAGDEYGSQSLEVLAQIAIPYSETATRILIHSCSGYFFHLATHRYGSHVLQTILQLTSTPLSSTDLALHQEAPGLLHSPLSSGGEAVDSSLPSLHDLIQTVVDELLPHASELAVHLCGSHVLRSLLCVLGGVQMETRNAGYPNLVGANRRGRQKPSKKKKRKTSAADSIQSSPSPHPGTMTIVYNSDSSRINPVDFKTTLEMLVNAILGNNGGSELGALQQMACHESAGPLLIVLVRVLTYSSDSARKKWLEGKNEIQKENLNDTSNASADFRLCVAKNEPIYERGSLADKVVRQILSWQDDGVEQKNARDVIYGLSGEARGSHLLEMILRLCPDDFHQDVIEAGDFLKPSVLQDYVVHDVSNFVVQNLLLSVRNREQAESLLRIIERFISSGLIINPAKKRRGILWRTAEIAAKFRTEQESLLKVIRLGFVAMNALDDNPEQSGPGTTKTDAEGSKKMKPRKKASDVQLKNCIPLLIGLQRNQADGHAITLDAAGTRSVFHMLRFTPRLCQDTLHGIINEMSTEDLVSIAKDGLGSRCLMDGILEGPVNTPIFAEATRLLRSKLSGHWTSLAADRVGQHTVKKLFQALPKIDDKAKLVEELANAGNRLNGTPMGRSVIEACAVDGYLENRKEWRQKISKLLSREESILAVAFPEKGIALGSTHDPKELATKSKRKRRRKKDTPTSSENVNDEPVTKAQKSHLKASCMSVDSIMKAMEN